MPVSRPIRRQSLLKWVRVNGIPVAKEAQTGVDIHEKKGISA